MDRRVAEKDKEVKEHDRQLLEKKAKDRDAEGTDCRRKAGRSAAGDGKAK